MNRISISTALLAAAIGIVTTSTNAKADEFNKKTIVKTTEAMEVPGVTLEPGNYVFKLVDSESDRHIVTIQNEREDHTYATILAVPNYRIQPTGKSTFLFWETPAGQPKALRAWFYPGDNFGQEFVYSNRRATEITQVTHQEVPSAPAAPAVAETTAPRQEQTTVAENTPSPAAPAPAVDNTPAPVAQAPAEAPAPPQQIAANPAPRALPQTASNLPLIALLGFLSIGAALVVGAFVKRMA